jgi:hypothetical protein
MSLFIFLSLHEYIYLSLSPSFYSRRGVASVVLLIYLFFRICFIPHVRLQTTKRAIELLFVRGDGIILVSPPLRTG